MDQSAFKPGGDIDGIAEDITVFDQHIAYVYPDAKVHPASLARNRPDK
ncbi:hypothetical protein LP421_01820 (plasmid) [Rhizobium sp. RCAM05350]|nr:hypothetical protein LP421_01820 [Rhizobium sp. RCAM05350]